MTILGTIGVFFKYSPLPCLFTNVLKCLGVNSKINAYKVLGLNVSKIVLIWDTVQFFSLFFNVRPFFVQNFEKIVRTDF